jgi:hypothetical protein
MRLRTGRSCAAVERIPHALGRRGRLGGVTTLVTGKMEPSILEPFADDDSDERRGVDRRGRPTPMLSRYVFFGGRRRHVRRDGEREGAFVDVRGAGVLVLVLGIVALNLLDAWFTLLFLSHGGTELNPVVQLVLDMGGHPWPFLLLKTVGIGVACAFLALTQNFRPARIGLWVVFLGYAALLVWHLHLLRELDSAIAAGA